MKKYYRMFNSCRIVKGSKMSMIYDLERMNNSNKIPNSLFDILTEKKNWAIEDVIDSCGVENMKVVKEYFEFLLENDYIFLCSKEELDLFPDSSLSWKSPKEITNSIIDYDGTISLSVYRDFIKELSELSCEAVQFRSKVKFNLQLLEKIGAMFEDTSITSVEFVLKKCEVISGESFIGLKKLFPRISSVQIYNSKNDSLVSWVGYSQLDIDLENDCGQIHSRFFSICLETFSEAQEHNTCLNRKISLSKDGLVKGCPSSSQSFGRYKINLLHEILAVGELKQTWSIRKDEIEVCKDCEYRYCCTDCRVFVDNSEINNSRPSKCDYNPYLGLWKGEDGYVPVSSLKENDVV